MQQLMFYLYSFLISLYIINIFMDSPRLGYVIGVFCIISLVLSFRGANRLYQIVAFIFIVIGLTLLLMTGGSLLDVPHYMGSTLNLLALFYVLPFINSVIVSGGYDQSISKLLKTKLDNLSQLYHRGLLVSLLLTSFLMISMIPMVHAVLEKSLKHQPKRIKQVIMSRVVLRGYALSLVWSPMEVLVVMGVDITRGSYLVYLPWLLLFTLLMFMADAAIALRYKRYPLVYEGDHEPPDYKKIFKRIFIMLGYLIVFIALIISVREWLEFSYLTAVTLVIIPYSMLWAFSIGRFQRFMAYCIPIWKTKIIGLRSYFVLFLSAGLFISVLTETTFMLILQHPFFLLSEEPLFLFSSIQVVFIGLAMIGFHPLVTLSILGEILQPLLIDINPLSMGLVLITSGISTVQAGPYNISVSLMANLAGENPYRISWWNLAFAMSYSTLGTILALVLL